MAKRLPKEEKETILVLNESDEPVTIYTFNADLKKRLKSFAKKYPDLCKMTREDSEYGSVTYELEKTRLQIRFTAPYSTERKKSASESARKNRKPRTKKKETSGEEMIE